MLLVQGRISQKNMAFYGPIDCVRFARYCGKMYSRHVFSVRWIWTSPAFPDPCARLSFTGLFVKISVFSDVLLRRRKEEETQKKAA